MGFANCSYGAKNKHFTLYYFSKMYEYLFIYCTFVLQVK